ncbi:hypothetical protein PHISP_05630 [Aspergillus sp. HF37]|nr:hypothetical protein PHISP_05630 [Aspergillus sp. HF37]
MATPSSPTNTTPGNRDNSPNRPTTTTEGGASAVPTPANNVGGGSGWGDEGFWKGGSGRQEPGHANAPNPQSTIGNFLGLSSQKGIAGTHNEERFDRAAGHADRTTQSGEPTCEGEDHSFMTHRPGCSQTLPGWGKAKDAFNTIHGQGR